MTDLGPKITRPDELLWRQVHPTFIQGLHATSQAFTPNKADEDLLSVAAASKASAEEAYRRYIARNLKSVGSWAFSVTEAAAHELAAHEDPIPEDDAHAVVNFRPHPTKQQKALAKKLANAANARGPKFLMVRVESSED